MDRSACRVKFSSGEEQNDEYVPGSASKKGASPRYVHMQDYVVRLVLSWKQTAHAMLQASMTC